MKRKRQGQLLTRNMPGESFQAFIPSALPPDPPIHLDDLLSDQLEQANRALGRLDGAAFMLPDISLFLYLYVRKEAVLSSQIEGTQSSLSDLLLFESEEVPGGPLDDVRDVSRYVAAMEYGLARIRDGFAISTRLLREIHEILRRAQSVVSTGSGGSCKYGTSQNRATSARRPAKPSLHL